MDWIIVIAGIFLLIIGFAGCIFPVIPGPPIAYGALLMLLMHSSAGAAISTGAYIWLGAGVVAVVVLDFILPVIGAKRTGGTKAGKIGSTIGLIFSLFLNPIMIIIGPFIGAVIGELVAGQTQKTALRSGLGSFLGFLTGTFLKIIVTGFIAYTFVHALIG